MLCEVTPLTCYLFTVSAPATLVIGRASPQNSCIYRHKTTLQHTYCLYTLAECNQSSPQRHTVHHLPSPQPSPYSRSNSWKTSRYARPHLTITRNVCPFTRLA
jgi:hypothetical protein